jgi:pimeloyl-ACP methyl ester carboxylesterase
VITMLYALLLAVIVDSTAILSVPVAPGEVLRVVTRGEGEAVVFIPGLLGSAYGYRHLTAPLVADGYRTIVIEPLGMGRSARPRRADYSLAAQANRVRAVLDSLDIASAVVVAHSLGSSIALHLAARYPNRVRGVVSIEGGIAETAMRPGLKKAMRWAPLIKLVASQDAVRPILARELRASSADDDWIADEVLNSYLADFAADVGATLDAFKGMADAPGPEGLEDRLPQIRAPVVLLLGAAPHKGAPAAEEVTALRTRVPTITVERVPDAGHFVHEERPAVVLAALVRVLASELGEAATLPGVPAAGAEADASVVTEPETAPSGPH